MRLMMVEETYEAPAPVSTKARHLIPSMLTITKGYVQALRFVVKRIFLFLSHMEVWWFELQMRHNLLLRQSEALCLTCDLLHLFIDSH